MSKNYPQNVKIELFQKSMLYFLFVLSFLKKTLITHANICIEKSLKTKHNLFMVKLVIKTFSNVHFKVQGFP